MFFNIKCHRFRTTLFYLKIGPKKVPFTPTPTTSGDVYVAFKDQLQPIDMPPRMSAVMDNIAMDFDLFDSFDANGDLALSTIDMDTVMDISGVQPLPVHNSSSSWQSLSDNNNGVVRSCGSHPRRDKIIPRRYAECSMDDLDQIALKKNAKGTHKNTKWGIESFKGLQNINISKFF